MRLFTGVMLILVAIVATVYGFFNLAGVLEEGGYGTALMRRALAILGGAGALLAAGIATLIWDISKRYERN